MERKIVKHYTNGEVTVTWKPDLCIHSRICFTGLPEVFDPRQRPWVSLETSTTESIVEQVKECPSGALSYEMKAEDNQEAQSQSTVIEVLKNGPLLVYGTVTVKKRDGEQVMKNKTTAFCRCGASANKPYCDGTHTRISFNDGENA